MTRHSQDEVLRYQKGRRSQGTVLRHYLKWRSEQISPLPVRCDVESCMFHTSSLLWNGEPLSLILDHKNGVSGDNRPENLRLLCPNCNSQQATHGGRNKGKVDQREGGFATIRPDGKRDYVLPAEAGKLTMSGELSVLSKSKPA